MAEHATSGIKFAGRVSQLITASTGFDDWEWGVTLWGRTPEEIKAIVYTMRFDRARPATPSSARFTSATCVDGTGARAFAGLITHRLPAEPVRLVPAVEVRVRQLLVELQLGVGVVLDERGLVEGRCRWQTFVSFGPGEVFDADRQAAIRCRCTGSTCGIPRTLCDRGRSRRSNSTGGRWRFRFRGAGSGPGLRSISLLRRLMISSDSLSEPTIVTGCRDSLSARVPSGSSLMAGRNRAFQPPAWTVMRLSSTPST